MIHGMDWGAYLSATNEIALPFADLVKAGLCDFFVCKGDQNVPYINTVANVNAAREAGVPVVGCYYWHYPLWSAQFQIDEYSRAIAKEKPDFIALDMEDTQGKSSWAVSENAKFVCAGLRENFPNLPLLIYTSRDYINTRAPDCNSWIGNYDAWIASWPWKIPALAKDRYLSFEEIKAYPLEGYAPAMPKGWTGKPFRFWQDNNWAIPEGYGWPYDHQYDWSVFNGSLDDLRLWCGLPVAPPAPSVEERLAKLESEARAHGWQV